MINYVPNGFTLLVNIGVIAAASLQRSTVQVCQVFQEQHHKFRT
jgi:hypothetical protein